MSDNVEDTLQQICLLLKLKYLNLEKDTNYAVVGWTVVQRVVDITRDADSNTLRPTCAQDAPLVCVDHASGT